MDDFEKELKIGFLEEAAQALGDTEQCFLNLETAKDDPNIIEKIFRLAHNLKGSARAVGFNEMGQFTHELESLLLKIKNKEIEIDTGIISLLLNANDHLQAMIQALKSNMDARVDSSELLAQIQDRMSGRGTAAASVPAETTGSESPSLAEVTESSSLAEVLAAAEAFEQAAAASTSSDASPAVDAAPASSDAAPVDLNFGKAEKKVAQPSGPVDESIRVSLGKLENLLNNVGEMVILQTVLSQQRYQIPSTLLQKTIVQLSKISKNIQEISMSLRMIPLKQTFQKMQRIVRDTSKAINKEVQLTIVGDDTELDKTVLDRIGDPLVHLIRNAVDHGIEDNEARQAAGKAAGSIRLSAYHKGGHIIIEVEDDGKGLDAEKLRRKAIEKGLLRADQHLSDEQAYQLIFAPGFSTKTEVTDISGRGVGLDVVKTNIESLQGEVHIITQLGRGTCFRIQLPLTLAIIEGMLVTCENERYVFPLAQMSESLRPVASDVSFVTGVGEVLRLRGQAMPLMRLGALLGRKVATRPVTQSIAIVCQMGDEPFAVLVDDIIGQQQVVSKRLGEELSNLKGITGGAVLGDGHAALILDLQELAASNGAKVSNSLKGVA